MDTPTEPTNAPEEKPQTNEVEKSEGSTKWTDVAGVFVNIILAFVTFLLFSEAVKDSGTAEKSAKAAEEAVAEQKHNDSLNRIEQIKKDSTDSITRNITFSSIKSSDSISKATLQQQINSFKSDSIRNQQNFDISKNTLQNQINSLKQSQTDFETENRPFMNFVGVVLDTTYPNNTLSINYRVFNVGKFPAKIIYIKTNIGYGIDTSKTLLIKSNWVNKTDNEYMPNNAVYEGNIAMPVLSDYYIKQIKRNIVHVYFFCEMKYSSSILNKNYMSYVVYQLDYTPKADVKAIRNEEY